MLVHYTTVEDDSLATSFYDGWLNILKKNNNHKNNERRTATDSLCTYIGTQIRYLNFT